LGVEIAKNIILSGVKSVGILDQEPVQISDLGSQFYLKESDVGKPRAECAIGQLTELNKYVNVHHIPVKSGCLMPYLDESVLKNYNLVVLTGKTVNEQIHVNKLCRKLGIMFIAADVHGLLGSVFIDLIELTVKDTNGEREKRGLISSISNDEKAIVTTLDKKRHDLNSGDFVVFTEVKGMKEINKGEPVKIKYKASNQFEIDLDTSKFSKYTTDGYFEQVKMPTTFKFDTLGDQVKRPTFQFYDGFEMECHCLRNAISAFQLKNGRMADPTKQEDVDSLIKFATDFASRVEVSVGEEWKAGYEIDKKKVEKLQRLAIGSRAQITPMTATLGGIVGQEIIKACMAKFTPIKQFFYFHALEALPEDAKPGPQYAAKKSRYDDYYAVFGEGVQAKIFDLNMFLIGSGAIGCEMLKNWAMMGLACGEKGQITITDMDTIEKSNLSRQFLFRPKDIGHMKAKVATAAAKVMNPKLNIHTDAIRVGTDTENVYDAAFWSKLDGATTALDNVKARLYIDQRCVEFSKPMVDSGTLGTKGNTQVVVPYLTEPYGEGASDQPEQGIPVCTLKSFPHKIEHTIQWARDKFEGWFSNGPSEVKSYIKDENYLEELASSPNEQLGNLSILNELLVEYKPKNFDDCVKWARLKYETLYHNDIVQLLTVYPENKTDAKGVPFWSGTKRRPSPLKFDADKDTDYEFIVAASNMFASVYGIEKCTDKKAIQKALSSVQLPKFVPDESMKIAATEEEAAEEKKGKKEEKEESNEGVVEQINKLTASLPPPSSIKDLDINPAKFEKDDPTNFHIDFITACSNLRAMNYRIKMESKHQTKFIAGKIIPAIATTTAMVTGMVCMEWYKIIQEFKLEAYRNSYANLALPMVTASEPFFPLKKEVKLFGEKKGEKLSFSSWDVIEIKIGNEMMKTFLRHFTKTYGYKVAGLAYGSFSLYQSMQKGEKWMKKRLKMPLGDVVQEISGQPLPKTDYLKLNLICHNPEENEDTPMDERVVEFPPVRFYYK